ncbi:MAG TPA: hypothetical protein VF048_02005, partial [Gemmatimonadaceae bacterium]
MSKPPRRAVPGRGAPAEPAHDPAHGTAPDAVTRAQVEDRLVELAGHRAAASLGSDRPGYVALCEWLAAEAERAQAPAHRRRTTLAAGRFADAVLQRRALARVAGRGTLRTVREAPPERAAAVAVPLVDAVVLARTRGCAPLLDL